MPSHENNRNQNSQDGKPRRRRRRPTRESLIEKGASPIRFELPDNALAGYPPAPPPPVTVGLAAPKRETGREFEDTPMLTGQDPVTLPPLTLAAPSVVFPPASVRSMNPRLRVWLWTVLGLVAGVPIVLTLIGALTSPPHVKGVPPAIWSI